MKCPTLAAGLLLALPSLLPGQPSPPAPAANPNLVEFFETKVRPVLAEHCFSCHGPHKQRGDIRLDAREHLVKPRDEGPVLVPGQPEKSAMVRAIQHEGEIKMPPKGKLPQPAIENITTWIKLGAVWPAAKSAALSADAWKKHWAFQPVRMPEFPDVANAVWAANPIDAFILGKLEDHGLSPQAPAEPRTLLRRLNFDLIGLPPTVAEVEEFTRAWETAS